MDTITEDLSILKEVYSNSRTWGHKCFAYYKGLIVGEHKIRYYNRTWERYQFESCLKGLCHKLDNEKVVPLSDRIAFYKKINN